MSCPFDSSATADTPAEGESVITISGERVLLGPPARAVVPLLVKWENDLALSLLSGDPARPLSREAVEAAFERFFKPPDDETPFVIYERATRRPIGITGLRQINRLHRTAEFGISIGEADCQGKGYGTEATRLVLDYGFTILGRRRAAARLRRQSLHRLVLDYGFTILGLHNIMMLRVYSFNARAVRAYHRAGFREIGRRRESHRVGGRVDDEVLMDCLATEFTGSVLARLLPE